MERDNIGMAQEIRESDFLDARARKITLRYIRIVSDGAHTKCLRISCDDLRKSPASKKTDCFPEELVPLPEIAPPVSRLHIFKRPRQIPHEVKYEPHSLLCSRRNLRKKTRMS